MTVKPALIVVDGGGAPSNDFILWKNRVYVFGVGGLSIWYYTNIRKSLTITLHDLNGAQVITGTSASVHPGANDISFTINDWLSANEDALSEGIYVLRVSDGGSSVFSTPIIVSRGSTTIDTVNGMKPTRIDVIDVETGVRLFLHPESYTVPLNVDRAKWLVLEYFYDAERGLGRLKTPGSETFYRIDTGFARLAEVKTSLAFDSARSMLAFLARMVSVDDFHTFRDVGRLINSNVYQALALLRPFGFVPLLGGIVLNVDIDINNYTMDVYELLHLGFFDIDTTKLKRVLLGVAGVAAIAAGAYVGGPIGAFLAGVGVASLGFSVLWPSGGGAQSPPVEEIRARVDSGIRSVEEAVQEAINTLEALRTQGLVSDVAYNELKPKIEGIRSTAVKALSDVKDSISDYYKQGYEKGYKDARAKWGAIGAAGGVILATLVRGE